MKPLCLVVAVCFLPCYTPAVRAQDVDFGLKLGVAASSFSGPQTRRFESGSRLGPEAGIAVGTALSPAISLRVELLYVSKGAHARYSDGIAGDWAVSYLELPVMLDLHPAGPRSGLRPHVFAGAALAANTGCRWFPDAAAAEPMPEGSCDAPGGGVGKGDAGPVLGAALEWGRPGLRWTLEGRFEPGLTDISPPRDAAHVLRNRSFAAVLGVSVPVGPDSPARQPWK